MINLNVTSPQGSQGQIGYNSKELSKWKVSSAANVNDINPIDGYFKYFEQEGSLKASINILNNNSNNLKDFLVSFKSLSESQDLIISIMQIDDSTKSRNALISSISNIYSTGSGFAITFEANIVNSSGSFISGKECLISFEIKGVQGFQGHQGHQGIQGVQGNQGVQGTQGIQGSATGLQGSQGHQGHSGNQGSQGLSGPIGLSGNSGYQGPQGELGPQGPQGDQGLQGPQGIFGGPQGFPGNQGIQGYQGVLGHFGIQGLQGNQGYQGPSQGYQGFQGTQGYVGNQGYQGITGPQGSVGNQGSQGQQGLQGHHGNQGAQGYQGVQGYQGEVGFIGAEGSQGHQGDLGNNGAQGSVGLQGTQGNQGTIGSQGNQGLAVQGPQGTQGDVGSQGFQGTQGSQGAQGFQGLGGGLQGAQGIQGVEGNTNSFTSAVDTTVSLLLHMNGDNNSTTFIDNSYSSKTITAFGNAKISTAQSKFGGASAVFDGNGDYIEFDRGTDLQFGAGDFTIEGWVNLSSLASYQTIFGGYDIGLDVQNSTTLVVGYNAIGGGFMTRTVSTISTGTWYHWAMSKTSGTFRLFWNGVQAGASAVAPAMNNAVAKWVIGKNATNNSSHYLNGYVDEVRVTKGLGRYTSNFTPPNAAFVNADASEVLPANPSVGTIVHFDNGVYACSSTLPKTWKKYNRTSNTFSITNVSETTNTSNSPARYTQVDASDFLAWRLNEAVGSTTFTSSINPGASTNLTIGSTSKFRSGVDEGLFQKTITFQGNADAQERYLRGAAAVVPSSSTSFSASVWIIPYSNALGAYSADPYIFGKYWHASSSWTAPYLGVYMGLNGAGGWGGGLYINGVGLVTFSAKTPLALNYPHLLAVTYDGNYIRLYQNGFLAGISSNYSGAAASYGSGPWYVGKAPVAPPGHSFDGQVWDIRVANAVRTEAYYRTMYLNGTARWG